MYTPQQLLQHHFGYSDFRPGQSDIVNSIITKHDTLALMPTGGGKSICFQVPGIYLGGTTLVISPLISLMKDQVDTLNSKGVMSTYINSSLTREEVKKRLELMKLGRFRFVYVAPERLLTKTFITICQHIKISLIAVDEAHCISMWGHDFRPSYTKISTFIKTLPIRPTIAAFTATATKQVKEDIINQLQLTKPHIFTNSFNRKNLHFSVIHCSNIFEQEISLFQLVKNHSNQSGIIYANTRDTVEYLSKLLNHYNIDCHTYHAGLDKDQRTKIQDDFVKNKIKLIAATNAFGMGVDKPNVRFVIHYQLPSNIENYYQEAGRAGRDTKQSQCYLLFNQSNIKTLTKFIDRSHPDKKDHFRKLNYKKLKTMVRYCTTKRCKTNFILEYFGEQTNENCHNCSSCKKPAVKPYFNKALYKYSHKAISASLQLIKSDKLNRKAYTKKLAILHTIHQPQTEEDYLRLPGIGQGWIDKWYNTLHDNSKPHRPIQTN